MNKKKITELLIGSNNTLLSISLLLIRGTIGIILFVVGSGKVLGWFGGFGMEQTVKMFSQMQISVILIYLSSFTEFLGGLLLTIGLFTRPVAIAVVINMSVATMVTLPNGFLAASGAALPFTFLMCAIVILIAGPMNYSLDNLWFKSRG